jgi:hypothetical protein
MSTAKFKKPPTHYLLAGSVVAGECFPDRDGTAFVLRLNKGTILNWKDRTKFRLLPTLTSAIASPLPVASIA